MRKGILILCIFLLVLFSSGCIETTSEQTKKIGTISETSPPTLFPEKTPTPTKISTPKAEAAKSEVESLSIQETTPDDIKTIELEEESVEEPTVEPHETPTEEIEDKDPAIEKSEQSEDCSGDESTKFNYPPADLDKIAFIKPMGMMASEHVAPTDHIYLWTYTDSGEVDVYSPAEGVVTNIQHMGSFRGDNDYRMDDYNLKIRHGCGLVSNFIHIDTLSPNLAKVAPEDSGFVFVEVPVEAGELIGTYSGSLDYLVIDQSVLLDFVDLESYKNDYNDDYLARVHISDPIAYFSDSSKLIEKSLRTEAPIGAFLDYDVDGRLVGTWFKENTNGWNGVLLERYWDGHLAIVYDAIDPGHVIVSTGDFDGRTGQFGVIGNSPDPGEVGVGVLVRYELTGYAYYDGDNRWDGMTLVKGLKLKNDESDYRGVVLFELVEDRKLKVEFFPDKKSSQVDGFTENVKIYVR